jgi:hypothetical protein
MLDSPERVLDGAPSALATVCSTSCSSVSTSLVGDYKCCRILNKICEGVEIPTSGPKGALYFTDQFGIPPVASKPNVTLTPIARETYAKDGNWKFTFLCEGCLSLNRDESGFSTATMGKPAEFGFAYVCNRPILFSGWLC